MCEEWSSCHGNQIGAPHLWVWLCRHLRKMRGKASLWVWVDPPLGPASGWIHAWARAAMQSEKQDRASWTTGSFFLPSLSHQELPCSPIVLSEPLRVKTEPSFCQAFSTVTQMWLMSNDFPPISVRGWREQTWCFEISICRVTEMSENVCFQFVILTESQAGRSL